MSNSNMLQMELNDKRKRACLPSRKMQVVLKKKQRYKLEKFIKGLGENV